MQFLVLLLGCHFPVGVDLTDPCDFHLHLLNILIHIFIVLFFLQEQLVDLLSFFINLRPILFDVAKIVHFTDQFYSIEVRLKHNSFPFDHKLVLLFGLSHGRMVALLRLCALCFLFQLLLGAQDQSLNRFGEKYFYTLLTVFLFLLLINSI